MSQQYGYSIKVCATCDYWSGKREIKQLGDYVELESSMDYGTCHCRNNGWYQNSVQASHNCPDWKKWGSLR